MKKIIDTSEVIGTVDLPNGTHEVCASAEAAWNESKGQLIVKLDAFLRGTALTAKETRSTAAWLPKPATVMEAVDSEEASELARDIFHRWTRKVREAAPALHGAQF